MATPVTKEKSPLFKHYTINKAPFNLKDTLKRGPVLVHFWATWCRPCLSEMIAFKELWKQYHRKGLSIVSISIDGPQTATGIKPVVKRFGFPFTILHDPNQDLFKRYKGQSVPYTMVIDQEGLIQYQHQGYKKGDETKIAAVIEGLMHKTKK